MTTPYLLRDIKFDEAPGGLPVLTAYPDPLTGADPWTIGYGSTGPDIREGVTWTPNQCEERLAAAVGMAMDGLDRYAAWWRSLCDARQDVLVNMTYNLGISGLMKFHHMLAACEAHNYGVAAEEMEDSEWAGQVHGRATRLALQMRSGLRVPTP